MNDKGLISLVSPFLQTVLTSSGLLLKFEAHEDREALQVEFTGQDLPLLLQRNAELLLSLEHLATQVLRLQPEEHDRVSFDAGGFKAQRERQLRQQAQAAIREVADSHHPFHFRPMNSRERRLLHLALAESGLRTASEGEGPTRHLVLHPAGDCQCLVGG